jgi:hypothetical protein
MQEEITTQIKITVTTMVPLKAFKKEIESQELNKH